MNLFFDCEFTGLRKDTTLISLGIVAEDGRKFYAEFCDYDESQCNDWINKNVIKNLFWNCSTNFSRVNDGGTLVEIKENKKRVCEKLHHWLSQFDSVQFVSDVCHYDFVLLIDLFGTAFDLPDNVSPVCHNLNTDIARHYGISEQEAFDKSREEIVMELCGHKVEGRKHNALYDAEVIKAIYGEIG